MAKVKKVKKSVIVRGPSSRALSIVQKYFPEVKTVKDSKANIKIEVTAADDKVATRKAHKGCAMAVACKRKMHLDGVIISVKTAYMVKGNKATRFVMPERASREIISYDRGGGFDTGTYILNKPSANSKLGVDRHRKYDEDRDRDKPKFTKAPPVLTRNIRTVLGSEVE